MPAIAVASALGPCILARGATDLERVKAVRRVSDLALAELRTMRRAAPPESSLGRHLEQIEEACAATGPAHGQAAQLRLVASVVERLLG